MRMHWVLMVAIAVSSSACFDNPSDEYAQLITGSWRMARVVAGKPAEGVLHLMPEGDYLLDNRGSARVARINAPSEGRWTLVRDELKLLALLADSRSRTELTSEPARLYIAALDHEQLVTTDPETSVRIEWVRVHPLN